MVFIAFKLATFTTGVGGGESHKSCDYSIYNGAIEFGSLRVIELGSLRIMSTYSIVQIFGHAINYKWGENAQI